MTEQEIEAEVERVQKLADVEFKELMADIKQRLGPDVATKTITWAILLRLQSEQSILQREREKRVGELEQRLEQLEQRLAVAETRGLGPSPYRLKASWSKGTWCKRTLYRGVVAPRYLLHPGVESKFRGASLSQ